MFRASSNRRLYTAGLRRLAPAALLLASGCEDSLPGKPDPADRPIAPAAVTSFEALYRQSCSGCHGVEGQLGPAPPLADPVFLAIVSDADLISVISNGRAGTPMPAFARRHEGPLTDAQIEIVARGLKQHWQSGELPEVALPRYALSPPEPAAAERGAEVFARACAACHGDGGEGNGADEKPGPINDPNLLALLSDQALRRIIITGRGDLGMPNFAGRSGRPDDFRPLSPDEISDLVALLARWRGPAPSPDAVVDAPSP